MQRFFVASGGFKWLQMASAGLKVQASTSHLCSSHLCSSHLCSSHLCYSHLCPSHLCSSHLCTDNRGSHAIPEPFREAFKSNLRSFSVLSPPLGNPRSRFKLCAREEELNLCMSPCEHQPDSPRLENMQDFCIVVNIA